MYEVHGSGKREEIVRALRDVGAPASSAQADSPDAAADLGDKGEARPLSLFVLADEPIFREGLLRLFARFPFVRVTGWTDRVTTALLMGSVKEADAAVVCLHPAEQVYDLAREIPDVPLLMLIAAPTLTNVAAANAAGVLGVLDRTTEIDDIVEAVRVVRRGLVVHPFIAADASSCATAPPDDVLVRIDESTSASSPEKTAVAAQHQVKLGAPELSVLTPREREILQLLVDGHSVKQVASRLGIAMQTGKNHIHNIMTKVGASTRLQLCAWANANGIQATRPLLHSSSGAVTGGTGSDVTGDGAEKDSPF